MNARVAFDSAALLNLVASGGSAVLGVGPAMGTASCTVDGPTVDVVNNAGSIVLTNGYGADRGYQEVDRGQYDRAEKLLAQAAAVHGAAAQAPADTISSSVKQETIDSEHVSDAVAVA